MAVVILFLAHILFVNLMVGGSTLALVYEIVGLRRKRYDALARAWAETAEQPGMPPLFAALLKRAGPGKIRSLIEDGADVNQRIDDGGVTALMWAALDCPDPAVLQVLLEAGAKVNVSDLDGARALSHAAGSNDNPEVVRVLIDAGANVNASDKSGKTALDMALERPKKDKGREKIVELLENAGARVLGGRKKR